MPVGYASIKAGLQKLHPQCLVVMPWIWNGTRYGATELLLPDLPGEPEVYFLHRLAESLAAFAARQQFQASKKSKEAKDSSRPTSA
ncbi:MAG: hypothetical protein HC913_18315 [Microscillaceae bacterium]|nr:hypothetical protein [Microscillaceae bacterium]